MGYGSDDAANISPEPDCGEEQVGDAV